MKSRWDISPDELDEGPADWAWILGLDTDTGAGDPPAEDGRNPGSGSLVDVRRAEECPECKAPAGYDHKMSCTQGGKPFRLTLRPGPMAR